VVLKTVGPAQALTLGPLQELKIRQLANEWPPVMELANETWNLQVM
jgi:hypothetical protein